MNSNQTRIPLALQNQPYRPRMFDATIDAEGVAAAVRAADDDGDIGPLYAIYAAMTHFGPVQSGLTARVMAVLADGYDIVPASPSEQDAVACDYVTRIIADYNSSAGHFDFFAACKHLAYGAVFPLAAVEKRYTASGLGYSLTALRPLKMSDLQIRPGDLKIESHDDLMLQKNAYVMHGDKQWAGGAMRAILPWYLFGSCSRDWWLEFLDHYQSPFFVGYTAPGDTQGQQQLSDAFSQALRLHGIVASTGAQIEVVSASANQGDGFELAYNKASEEITKILLGQSLSSGTSATGLGSGVANLHADVREDLRKWDAARLSETIQNQLFKQILTINGIAGNTPKIVFGKQAEEDLQLYAGVLKTLRDAGLEPAEDSLQRLSKTFGLTLQRVANQAVTQALPVSFAATTPPPAASAAEKIVAARNAADYCVVLDVAEKMSKINDDDIKMLVAKSSDANDLRRRLGLYIQALQPDDEAELINSALAAFAANAVQRGVKHE
jgi:Protein of unknown function (DUF935)